MVQCGCEQGQKKGRNSHPNTYNRISVLVVVGPVRTNRLLACGRRRRAEREGVRIGKEKRVIEQKIQKDTKRRTQHSSIHCNALNNTSHDIHTTNIPDVELETILYEGLDVETLGGHDMRNLLIGELLQNRGLSSIVETEEKDTNLFVTLLKLAEEIEKTHVDCKRLSKVGGLKLK